MKCISFFLAWYFPGYVRSGVWLHITGVWQQLSSGRQESPVGGVAALELQGLSAVVHDRIPRAVRRVDRVNVGLYSLLLLHLYPVLPAHHDHRQSRRAY